MEKTTAVESLDAVKEQLVAEQTSTTEQNERTNKEMISLKEEIKKLTEELASAQRFVFRKSILKTRKFFCQIGRLNFQSVQTFQRSVHSFLVASKSLLSR